MSLHISNFFIRDDRLLNDEHPEVYHHFASQTTIIMTLEVVSPKKVIMC